MSTVHRKMLVFLMLDRDVPAVMDRERNGKPKGLRDGGASRVLIPSHDRKRRWRADPSPLPAAGN